jgi:hypothetical protein
MLKNDGGDFSKLAEEVMGRKNKNAPDELS